MLIVLVPVLSLWFWGSVGAPVFPGTFIFSIRYRQGGVSVRSVVLSFQQANHQAAETCNLQVVWLKLETLGTLQGIMGGMGAENLETRDV